MKKIVSLFIAVLAVHAHGQTGLTQSADGSSSVLFKGIDLNVDIVKTDISLGANNLRASIGENEKFIYGGSIKTKNKEGIANLFSKGDIVPEGGANIFMGYSFSNALLPSTSSYNIRKEELAAERKKLKNDLQTIFASKVSVIINKEIKALTQTDANKLGGLLKDGLKEHLDLTGMRDFLNSFTLSGDASAGMGDVLKSIREKVKIITDDYDEKIEALNKESDRLDEKIDERNFWHLTFFGFGGINASEFKRFKEFDSTNFGNSFTDISFRGGNFGAGVNFQYRNVLFGLTYSYRATNNFQLLSKKDYTLTEKKVNGTSSLTEEKEITAYTGNYGEVEINELAFDMVINVKPDKNVDFYMLINPYVRASFFSRDVELLPNKLNVGAGFYLFKGTGKLMGGFYIELPDVENNYEKIKPIDKQNLRPPLQRMTFGLVGKLSLGSMLGS